MEKVVITITKRSGDYKAQWEKGQWESGNTPENAIAKLKISFPELEELEIQVIYN